MSNPFELNDKVKYFLIRYQPDLNEGRGFQAAGIVKVEASMRHRDFAEHWCYERFGNKYAFVMGAFTSGAMTENWSVGIADKSYLSEYPLLDTIVDTLAGFN